MKIIAPWWFRALVSCIQSVASWPRCLIRGLSICLARIAIGLKIDRVAILSTNLSLCFPELSLGEHAALVQRSLVSMLEGGLASFWVEKQELLKHPLFEIQGLEILEAAMKQDCGIIILHPHLVTLELAGHFIVQLGQQFSKKPIGYTYRPAHSVLVDALQQKMRPGKAIDATAVFEMARFLKQGGILLMFPDHDMGLKRSVFADFFGIQTATCPAFSKLASLTQSICLPVYLLRTQGGGYCLTIDAPIECAQPEDKMAQWLNAWVESIVKQASEQYFWVHRRFKTRPPGSRCFYDRKR
jgi:Kdo2-lipid IVA lauroyltransferase/acyltransferase